MIRKIIGIFLKDIETIKTLYAYVGAHSRMELIIIKMDKVGGGESIE